jgi:serine/threonine protein kinase
MRLTSLRDVAIKVIDKSRFSEEDREGMRAEVAILKLVNHPCLIKFHRVFETNRCVCLCMSNVGEVERKGEGMYDLRR